MNNYYDMLGTYNSASINKGVGVVFEKKKSLFQFSTSSAFSSSGWTGPSNAFCGVSVNKEGTKAVFWGSSTIPCVLVDLQNGSYLNSTGSFSGNIRSVTFMQNQEQVLIGTTSSPYMELWDIATMTKSLVQLPFNFATSNPYWGEYSNDGSRIAFSFINSPQIVIVSAFDFSVLGSILIGSSNGRHLAWSSDDSMIISFTTGNNGINVYSTSTFALVPGGNSVMGSLNGDSSGGAFSPSGEKLAILSHYGSATTALRIVENAKTFPLTLGVSVPLPGAPTSGAANYMKNVILKWVDDVIFITHYYRSSEEKPNKVIVVNSETKTIIDQIDLFATGDFFGFIAANPSLTYRKVGGVVLDIDENPVSRTVRVYHRTTGEFLREAVSSPLDGTFEVGVFTPDSVYALAIGEGAENTKIIDKVIPAPWLGTEV